MSKSENKELTVRDVYNTFSGEEKRWIEEACRAAIKRDRQISFKCGRFLRQIRDGLYSTNQQKVVYFLLGKAYENGKTNMKEL